MEFREYKKTDFNFLFELLKASMREQIELTYGSWDDNVEKEYLKASIQEYEYKIIMLNNSTIGCVSWVEFDDSIFINELQILPEYQNNGIGTKILHGLIEYAGSQHKKVILEVLKTNTQAISLYKKLKFNIVDENSTHKTMVFIQGQF
jgi:ribosomal protein S18 acetylase RimI-like enzyme